ncbi:MAG: M20/M25/M40 family metallo-hydrolase [Deltaproteobacteria bacterium]|nr:M20/M25/M40 family metallo-hydrolase [Deltaproteobacteria bacterium]MDQ3296661.1 M20/M25/M40 family metallo-hydrolase [Myxococcota bacterium]
MKGATLFLIVVAGWFVGCCPPDAMKPVTPVAEVAAPVAKELALPEEVHLKNVRQLTFGGDNAEAYWSFAGDQLILQSNHKPYQCDQIEVISKAGGAPKLVSTGKGRTTCAYFLKGDREIVYASTHETSPTCPTPPDNSQGYLWALFEYDIFKANADGSNLTKLVGDKGYDAEATVCGVDGSIIFTSDRSGDLELYRMDADGKNVRQLTNAWGYDGGAFFSADCTKIVWRASRPEGKDLEAYKALLAQKLVKPTRMDLYVANADGSDARQVTYLPGASFAPFFFPDGKRIIFSSNYLAPRGPDFDLFAIDIDGKNLERITYTGGFDGFPVFSPDGKTLAFSSNRRDVVTGKDGEIYRMNGAPAGKADTNLFLADWVDAPVQAQAPQAPETAAAARFAATVQYLADDAREGRGVGTRGLEDAITMVRGELEKAGVTPGVPDWQQSFEVTTEVKRGAATALAIDGKPLAAEDFAPLAASASGSATGEIVAVGWGLVDADAKLDDYKGKNVKGKIVLVHRFVPPDAKLDAQQASRLGDLRYKSFIAKGKGAKGVIVVDDGDPKSEEAPLPKLSAAESEAQLPIVVVTRKAGAALRTGKHTAKLTVALEPVRTKTANLVGVIRAGAAQKLPGVIVIGAHLDHLGMGGGPSALDPTVKAVHNGADDNASGVAALIEAARTLAPKQAQLQRDIYFVAFSAEEMGALGAAHYLKNAPTKDPIVAMLNMDMVGRMKMSQLHVNGGDSAKEWKEIVAPVCAAARVNCTIGGSGYGPSDHMPFYIAGTPVLFFFTGSHREYHTANDDIEKINAIGGARVAMIAADTAFAVANRPTALTYVKSAPESMMGGDVRRRGASLGTVPSYSEEPNQPKGVVLSDVVPDGAAAKAGLKAGDRIIQIGTHEIATVPDLMYVLEAAKPGAQTTITFVRDGKSQTVPATFGTSRRR